jgi:hypothetical protein
LHQTKRINKMSNTLSIREAKDLVEANLYCNDGSVSKLMLIKMLRDQCRISYHLGYDVRSNEVANNEPSQLDRIEAKLDAVLKRFDVSCE